MYRAMGADYPMSYGETVINSTGEGEGVIIPGIQSACTLPEFHEINVYTGRTGVLPKYYGKDVGEDAPYLISYEEWFEIMALNLPRDMPFLIDRIRHGIRLPMLCRL